MIVLWSAVTCLAQYVKLNSAGELARPEAPVRCRKCRAKNRFWRHGSYLRWVAEALCCERIKVERFKCKCCGKTVSVLPVFVVRRRHFSMNLIAERTEAYAEVHTSYRRLANGPGKPPCSSPSQIWRWVNVLCKRAKNNLLELQAECTLERKDEKKILLADKAGCANSWKAMTREKQEKLNDLARTLAFGRVQHDKTDSILCEIRNWFLNRMHRIKDIFAGEPKEKKTPQKAAPRNS